MARPFKELRARMRPEHQKRAEEDAERTLLEMNLQELRRNVAHLTQKDTAELLRKSQAAISELEKREDMLLSSLSEYVRVLGGELDIRARFPDREIRIRQFEAIRQQLAGG